MNYFNNEDEIYNNQINYLNDIKIENEKNKINKYKEEMKLFITKIWIMKNKIIYIICDNEYNNMNQDFNEQ